MNVDPGQVLPLPRRRQSRMPMGAFFGLGLVGVVVLAATIPAVLVYASWADHAHEQARWDVKGPPCAVVAEPASWAKSSKNKLPQTFEFGGASFTRQFGHSSCEAFNESGLTQATYQVCQFNAPGYITVETAKARVTFQPEPGRPATVTVRRGLPTCVIGGWFKF